MKLDSFNWVSIMTVVPPATLIKAAQCISFTYYTIGIWEVKNKVPRQPTRPLLRIDLRTSLDR